MASLTIDRRDRRARVGASLTIDRRRGRLGLG